jgi:hypothetical protein
MAWYAATNPGQNDLPLPDANAGGIQSGQEPLYITDLALYLPFAGVPAIAVDSGWSLKVKDNIAVIDIPPRQ